ncbi:hypothetical protein GGR28_002045 [Lewinella aquimaris]|uniref:Pycsar effector protein domain-containing protein n=1 Tax=Neolewinella aquimaris TaxID=1835722 RepID=A0A840E726_9BACT|nr:Pycsar system effector family protein [Neolewinella aquimaris]MBB4079425.1 hypothetical protein [Neolewinella aquimaris]
MDEKTENYWRILDANLEWIRYSDAKATGILTIYGVIITVAFTKMIDILEVISGSWVLIGLTTISGLCSLVAIYFGFRSISPRLVSLHNSSIIFFGSILEHSKNIQEFREYSHRVLDSPKGLDDDLAGQIYINARIAAAKFQNVSSSIRFFIASFLILLAEMVLILLLS